MRPVHQHRPSFCTRLEVECLEDRTLLSAGQFVPNEVLVKFNDGIGEADKALVRALVQTTQGMHIQTDAMRAVGYGNLEVFRGTADVFATVDRLNKHPLVAYAEPNWVYSHQAVANDPYYINGNLWGMYSNDSPFAVGPAGTTNPYGSQVEEAWAAGHTGSRTVYVGIIDEGIQFTHPDLQANVWTNPYDTPGDGIDNDGNGYVDDVHGWDFINGDNTIYDGTHDDHGTHVAGTIAAPGGNGIGVAGVNWNVSYISGKFLGPNGGTTLDAIKAIDYLTDLKVRHGLNIVATNNSWGGGSYSKALLDAIVRGAKQNILFIAAAGNSGENNDGDASYPANYDTTAEAGYDAVIAVAAIDKNGKLPSWSNYGAKTVDLGAPGVGIYSTVPTDNYKSYSGTSMATPHVTGAVALYAAAFPGATAAQIKAAILNSSQATAALTGKTVTGGRLDVSALMETAPFSIDMPFYAAAGNGQVRVFDSAGAVIRTLTPYAGYSGTLRVATGDINQDGVQEVIVAVNGSRPILIFDGVTGKELASFNADWAGATTGPLSIAAGDFNGDGRADIVVGKGNGPLVKVFSGAAVLNDDTAALLFQLRAFGRASGGVRVAAGLVNHDAIADLVVARGRQAAPHVRVFDGSNPTNLLASFKAFGGGRSGLFVAVGDITGDGRDDVIVGRGPGHEGRVRVFDVNAATPRVVHDFLAFSGKTGGVRVAAIDVNNDRVPDILATPGGNSKLRVFDGADPAMVLEDFEAFPDAIGDFFAAGTGVARI